MLAPALTQEMFDECYKRGLCIHKAIGKLNSNNCRKDFSATIPKPLREGPYNAFLVIKNHRERWKYIGFNVEKIAGALHIKDYPEIIWSGYVMHDGSWYAVNHTDLIKGKIKNSSKIILPEVEYVQG